MKFLYMLAEKSIYDLPWALLELGHEVTILENWSFDPLNEIDESYQALRETLTAGNYDFLISYIFFPRASDLCEELNIDYISWTYDSPLVSLFHRALFNSHNYTFIFDRREYEFFKNRQAPHVYHLPMGANISRTGCLEITPEDEKNYTCDISFIGNLYEENSYNSIIHFFPEHLATELKTWLMKNLCNWKETKNWPMTSPAVTQFLLDALGDTNWNRYDMEDALYYGMLILTRKLAEMDRITVLNTLAEHYSVDFYTNSVSNHLNHVNVRKGVDYYTDMNKIFYLSKINLNITLPSIETGLPQRIFDIMGCGGFVLTNYQEEIDDLFTIGKEIEVFHDLQELLDKTAYYLSHEKERLQIAMNGYQAVRAHHSYEHRINQILQTVQKAKESQ